MAPMQGLRKIVPILAATVWISVSEFIRNQLIFIQLWVDHYKQLGLTFPAAPINGMLWGIWSLVFATVIYVLAQKFSLWHTTALAWVVGFVLMWLVIGNLDVLPLKLLIAAVPLSLLEAFVATWIVKKLST
jgi:hypothetical protein